MPQIKKIATRQSYGEVLAELGEENKNIVVLDADLSGSTKTSIFAQKFPDRFINCGIAEGNMAAVAAGLAAAGKIPFMSSFAMFAVGRAFEQIRNSICLPALNVKICASHAGVSVGADGGSHQCLEDIALMRTMPNMVVMSPSDDVEARAAVRKAVEIDGPVYIRLGRLAVPVINDYPEYKFEFGKGQLLRSGSDVTIVTTGLCVDSALKADVMLRAAGVKADVINICTIKPLDEEIILRSAAKTGKVLVVEEGFAVGGLGSAVTELLCDKLPTRVKRVGLSKFGESGEADELLAFYHLDADGIFAETIEFIKK